MELRPFRNRTQHLGAGPVGVGGALCWTLGAGGGVLGDGYLSTLSPVAACSRTARAPSGSLGLPERGLTAPRLIAAVVPEGVPA
jgi:hypothetical protein